MFCLCAIDGLSRLYELLPIDFSTGKASRPYHSGIGVIFSGFFIDLHFRIGRDIDSFPVLDKKTNTTGSSSVISTSL